MGEGTHIRKMALVASFTKKTFHFNFKARTSRGSMAEKDSWFIKIYQSEKPDVFGLGEAGPLPGLSPEHQPEFEEKLQSSIDQFNLANLDKDALTEKSLEKMNGELHQKLRDIHHYPSILFAFETALLDLAGGGQRLIFTNGFTAGTPIPINGLIWMAGIDMMLQQIEIKIQEGFRCLKLKVGGFDFEKECDILQYIRRKYFRMDITVRLDANGAFKPDEAMYKLHELSKFTIHSIEQPLKPGSPHIAELCKQSPIPIALDEELIGVYGKEQKKDLLVKIRPQYIILKPTLHGGLLGCKQWINAAEELNIGWWMTSALESNIGLNAIAQFTSEYNNPIPQGLGTGKIYEDNIESPLNVKRGFLSHNPDEGWGLDEFN